MREIRCEDITKTVRDLCIKANSFLPQDVRSRICQACETESWPLANSILRTIRENFEIAEHDEVPICQDTGAACVFVTMGQDVYADGSIAAAIDEGVRQGYADGYLRKSIVSDPLDGRVNTGDNTPAMIYWDVVPGDAFRITIAPKGFGSENMSRIKMLRPADGVEGVKEFVVKTVEEAGPNPCPPIIVGVGIGGTFDKAALLAKKALMRRRNRQEASEAETPS